MIGYIPGRLDVLELMLQKGANVHYLVNEDETILESYGLYAHHEKMIVPKIPLKWYVDFFKDSGNTIKCGQFQRVLKLLKN